VSLRHPHTAESRAKISASLRGNRRRVGVALSSEHRAALLASRLGKKDSPQTVARRKQSARKVKGTCAYCGDPATTRDHTDPDDNETVWACLSCNSAKGHRTVAEFMDYLEDVAASAEARLAWARKRIRWMEGPTLPSSKT
jgi:5-methylcytosine-specific restriction endonuclease McrA